MRGAAEGTDLVEYYVECDLVARALDNDRIRCIQKISHINPPGKPRFLANMPSCTIASFTILIVFWRFQSFHSWITRIQHLN